MAMFPLKLTCIWKASAVCFAALAKIPRSTIFHPSAVTNTKYTPHITILLRLLEKSDCRQFAKPRTYQLVVGDGQFVFHASVPSSFTPTVMSGGSGISVSVGLHMCRQCG